MIKAIAAVTIAAFCAAAITLLPSFAPSVQASVPPSLTKTDRLPVQSLRAACAGQNWPNIDVSCLRRSNSNTTIQPVRVVSTERS